MGCSAGGESGSGSWSGRPLLAIREGRPPSRQRHRITSSNRAETPSAPGGFDGLEFGRERLPVVVLGDRRPDRFDLVVEQLFGFWTLEPGRRKALGPVGLALGEQAAKG